ncbi:hypothetical protein pb186bvf_015732 [Paramecium bursaria]
MNRHPYNYHLQALAMPEILCRVKVRFNCKNLFKTIQKRGLNWQVHKYFTLIELWKKKKRDL